jgi:acetyl-CoA carboxylase carboxyl transferase subunit beta
MPASERGEAILRRIGRLPVTAWQPCRACGALLQVEALRRRHRSCPECGHCARMSAVERIEQLTDPGSFAEQEADLLPADPCEFTDRMPYPERIRQAQAQTGLREAALVGRATVDGHPIALAVLDFAFLGGSMGSVVGEKVARVVEYAAANRVPLITVAASGGARMQEGALSLLQMAKTAAAVGRLRAAGVPYLSVLTDPVYGGVAASFASLGDIVVAEAGTRAGFAGPQVIQQTIREELPAGFQTADFLREHGHIDLVAPRHELRRLLARLVAYCAGAPAGNPAAGLPADPGADPGADGGAAGGLGAVGADGSAGPGADGVAVPGADRSAGPGAGAAAPGAGGAAEVDAWQAVRLARATGRPTAADYAQRVFTGFLELHGDRWSGDDPAVLGGLAWLDNQPVLVVGTCKGTDTAQNVRRNFGMPHPAGYRKAIRLFTLAERLAVPVVTLVDTPGAYPGLRAEEGNQSGAIAAALVALTELRVPVVSVVTGEGGSGGALALAAGDRLLMQENAILSVISPEGCATILFGDAGRAPEAARLLRLRAVDLFRLGVADGLVPEPAGGSQADPGAAAELLRTALRRQLAQLARLPVDELVARRYRRLRRHGGVQSDWSTVLPLSTLEPTHA